MCNQVELLNLSNGNLHTPDDIILDSFTQVREVGAVACNPYNQVPVILRVLLRVQKFFVSHNI